ncbi:MAG: hypothetical protein E7047_07625, partial [Lentisphaerae bacterium]|nr:hypothetical protein [Lentisphaerota bacterium]
MYPRRTNNMKIKKKNLIIAISGAVILLLAACSVWGYLRYAAPTRILLVNYPEYMLAPLLDQPLNPALDIQAIQWNDQSGEELRNADCIIFFGMGLNFTAEQQKLISELDVPMYTTSSTRAETALKKMPPEHLENIQAYLNGGGKANFKNMLDYIRYHLDGKRINAPRPALPQKFERKKYFHIDEKDSFATFAEYSQWYRSSGRFNADNATVLILGGNGGGALGGLIEALEKRRLNVVSAHGMWPVGQDIDAIAPDLVIYQPHGRLGDEAVEYLKKRNIPLFCPIKVNQPYEEYLKDQRGMTGGMLSQSITMPELDGGCVPFVLSALFRNERGLLEFRMIPDRLERFADLVQKTTLLKTKPNSEKKIAIIYYGSIGKESATAGLGTAESLLNILRYLQQNNYNTGTLPASVEALDREIKANTAIFGKLNGSQTPNSRLVSTVTVTGREYEQWVKKSMPSDLYSTVVERYGAFPGRTIFRTPEGNMRLGCIRFGNAVLMPQSLPGEGASENKLIHGVKFSPPHTYIATYLYLQHGFQADAIMHLGTHGSLEFTPWKQAALSSYDWPDVLIGSMPHYYLYIINNIGEAEIAKRRSYATMLSHLTPPFMNSEAYGPIAALQEKLHAFEIADNPRLKAEYGKSIIELVKKENYHRDLQLSDQLEKGVLTDEDMLKLQQYLHEISDAKVNRGIYIIGRPYTLAEANETARLMTVDAIAEKLFQQDLAAGKVAASQRQDKAFFRANYLKKAHTLAENVLQNTPPEAAEAILRQASQPSPAHPQKNIDPEAMQKMIASGKLPDGRTMPPEMMQAIKQMNMSPEAMRKRTHQARPAAPAELTPEVMMLKARADLLQSTDSELASILNAFNGGYITAGPGGD